MFKAKVAKSENHPSNDDDDGDGDGDGDDDDDDDDDDDGDDDGDDDDDDDDENEKKRQYSRRVLEVEQGSFTPLVFTSNGGTADECKRFHSRLVELLALKKGDDCATTISWIRAKVSFAILRSALLCLRGTRRKRRAVNISDIDITLESAQARI